MARKARQEPKVRLSLEVAPSVRERLDTLRDLTEADTLSEVVRHALVVYETLKTHSLAGGEVILRTGTDEKKLLLF